MFCVHVCVLLLCCCLCSFCCSSLPTSFVHRAQQERHNDDQAIIADLRAELAASVIHSAAFLTTQFNKEPHAGEAALGAAGGRSGVRDHTVRHSRPLSLTPRLKEHINLLNEGNFKNKRRRGQEVAEPPLQQDSIEIEAPEDSPASMDVDVDEEFA
jgi:hypothetical protein